MASEDRFKSIAVIGSGAFGVVHKVKDTGSISGTEIYALKIIKNDKYALNECELMSKLSHPNILRFLMSRFGPNGDCQLVFEYCSGGDLNAGLQRSSSQELKHRWMRQIVDGVAHMHFVKIAHRDLKPENVLLTSSDDIRICDFGLSQKYEVTLEVPEPPKSVVQLLLEQNSRYAYLAPEVDRKYMESKCGTPGFCAPEQMRENGHGYTYKADVFALGLLLYCIEERTFIMVNRKRYYGAFVHNIDYDGYNNYNWLSLLMAERKQEYAPQFKSCNISLVNTILSCLRNNPKMRPDAKKLRDELNNILATG